MEPVVSSIYQKAYKFVTLNSFHPSLLFVAVGGACYQIINELNESLSVLSILVYYLWLRVEPVNNLLINQISVWITISHLLPKLIFVIKAIDWSSH